MNAKQISINILLVLCLAVSAFFNIKNIDRNQVVQAIADTDAVLLQNRLASETLGKKLSVVDISTLCDSFNTNKELAQKEYASRYIILNAEVGKGSVCIDQGTTILGKNQTSISFNYEPETRKLGWFDYKTVLCTMIAGQEDSLKGLKTGDKIKIRGLMNGTIGRSIIIDGCEILK